jgi:hypothetical protein
MNYLRASISRDLRLPNLPNMFEAFVRTYERYGAINQFFGKAGFRKQHQKHARAAVFLTERFYATK